MNKKIKNAFTLIELVIVILIITILFGLIKNFFKKNNLNKNIFEIQYNINFLKNNVGGFPNDLKKEYYEKLYMLDPIENIFVKIGQNGVEDYKYINKKDIKVAFEENGNFKGYNYFWENNLVFDDKINKKKMITKIGDGWNLLNCKTLDGRYMYDFKVGDYIYIYLDKKNSYLINRKESGKNLDSEDNFQIKMLRCTFEDRYGTKYPFILKL